MAISIKQFQAIANGKYNLGELTVSSNGKRLGMVNNHVKMTFLNNKIQDRQAVRDIKEAFVAAFAKEVPKEKMIADVRKMLGLPPDKEGASTEESFKPLTRMQVREILNKYTYNISVGESKLEVHRTMSEENSAIAETINARVSEKAEKHHQARLQERLAANGKFTSYILNDFRFSPMNNLKVTSMDVKAAVLHYMMKNPETTRSHEEIKAIALKYAVCNACIEDKEISRGAAATIYATVNSMPANARLEDVRAKAEKAAQTGKSEYPVNANGESYSWNYNKEVNFEPGQLADMKSIADLKAFLEANPAASEPEIKEYVAQH